MSLANIEGIQLSHANTENIYILTNCTDSAKHKMGSNYSEITAYQLQER
jgi:hypothetical protein